MVLINFNRQVDAVFRESLERAVKSCFFRFRFLFFFFLFY